MSNTQAVCGEQLIEKLSKLSEQSHVNDVAELKVVHKQRERFQQRHNRSDDWRRKTQPVTMEEVKEADRYVMNLNEVSWWLFCIKYLYVVSYVDFQFRGFFGSCTFKSSCGV